MITDSNLQLCFQALKVRNTDIVNTKLTSFTRLLSSVLLLLNTFCTQRRGILFTRNPDARIRYKRADSNAGRLHCSQREKRKEREEREWRSKAE